MKELGGGVYSGHMGTIWRDWHQKVEWGRLRILEQSSELSFKEKTIFPNAHSPECFLPENQFPASVIPNYYFKKRLFSQMPPCDSSDEFFLCNFVVLWMWGGAAASWKRNSHKSSKMALVETNKLILDGYMYVRSRRHKERLYRFLHISLPLYGTNTKPRLTTTRRQIIPVRGGTIDSTSSWGKTTQTFT